MRDGGFYGGAAEGPAETVLTAAAPKEGADTQDHRRWQAGSRHTSLSSGYLFHSLTAQTDCGAILNHSIFVARQVI